MGKQKQLNSTAKKIQARWRASYNWALSASYQEIHQILSGVEKTIEWKEGDEILSTGVSNTDKAAIQHALNFRLSQENKK